jgi:Resolvase, N terminal domain
MKGVSRRDFDMVLAWSVDRLGRSLTGLLELLTELHAKHVDLYLHQQGLDTSTPSGKAMFQMMGVRLIQEHVRTIEDLARSLPPMTRAERRRGREQRRRVLVALVRITDIIRRTFHGTKGITSVPASSSMKRGWRTRRRAGEAGGGDRPPHILGRIGRNPLGLDIETLLGALNHDLRRADLGLSDGATPSKD